MFAFCREVEDRELIAQEYLDYVAPEVLNLNENDEKDISEVLSIIKGQSKILNGLPNFFSYLVHLRTENAIRNRDL